VFSDHIRQTADKLATELREVKSKNRAADTSVSEKLAKTEVEIASAGSTISGKQRQKEQKESQLSQREHQAGQIQMSDEMLQEFEEEVERCEEELASAQKRLEEQNYDAKLKSADQQLTEV
jgi:chromosome segregation ATPase